MSIIDIHTHMLCGIDDGARDREMTLALMGKDFEQGVRGIFCTNHSYGMEENYRKYHTTFEQLKPEAESRYPGLKLYKGCEIFCCKFEMPEIISNIRNDIFPVMNETTCVLMEFGPHETNGMEEMEYCLQYALNAGFLPIIAHAERYRNIYDDPLGDLARLKNLGCKVQINLFSVVQDQGHKSGGSRKKLANLFLDNNLVDFVGTDTHRLDYKWPEAAVGAAAIREKYGEAYANAVLFRNAEKILCTTQDAHAGTV